MHNDDKQDERMHQSVEAGEAQTLRAYVVPEAKRVISATATNSDIIGSQESVYTRDRSR